MEENRHGRKSIPILIAGDKALTVAGLRSPARDWKFLGGPPKVHSLSYSELDASYTPLVRLYLPSLFILISNGFLSGHSINADPLSLAVSSSESDASGSLEGRGTGVTAASQIVSRFKLWWDSLSSHRNNSSRSCWWRVKRTSHKEWGADRNVFRPRTWIYQSVTTTARVVTSFHSAVRGWWKLWRLVPSWEKPLQTKRRKKGSRSQPGSFWNKC